MKLKSDFQFNINDKQSKGLHYFKNAISNNQMNDDSQTRCSL